MNKPPLKSTHASSQPGAMSRKKLKEKIESILTKAVPDNLVPLNSQNKKLRGFLKIYNNFLTALIKKSSKSELLGTGNQKSEFKNRSVEVQIQTLEQELLNLGKLVKIKKVEVKQKKRKKELVSDPKKVLNFSNMKENLEKSLEQLKKDTVRKREIKKLQEKQLMAYQKTGRSGAQNQI